MYEVGQDVFVFDRTSRKLRQEPGTITKVGRKIVTIEYGNTYKTTGQFRIDTQVINDRYGHKWFRTPEQVAESDRRNAAWNTIKEHGLGLRSYARPEEDFSTELLEELAALLARHRKCS